MEEVLDAAEYATAGLLPVLSQLDCLLHRAVRMRQSEGNSDPLGNNFPGLYISNADVERALQHTPGAPAFPSEQESLPVFVPGSPLNELSEIFSLSSFDLTVIAIALAPEIDLRYERLYAFLQDDVTRKLPTVELILNLLCASTTEKLRRRDRFDASAPLLRHEIIHLLADPNCVHTPLLAHHVKVDQQIVRQLLGKHELDSRLLDFCSLTNETAETEDKHGSSVMQAALRSRIENPGEGENRLILCLRGGSQFQRRQAALAALKPRGKLLTADFACCIESGAALHKRILLVLREARLQRATAYLENFESVDKNFLSRAVAEASGTLILGSGNAESSLALEKCSVTTMDLRAPDRWQRREYWKSALEERGVQLDNSALERLADSYRLTPEQIRQAASDGCARSRAGRASQALANNATPVADDFFNAARSQSGLELRGLARKLRLTKTWDDLVLPQGTIMQLREFCARVARAEQVLGDWGFDQKLSSGKGATALFVGPSGAGKTMAAEVIANEIKLDLYTIDLANVISKYIGETEKNLERIFTVAQGTNTVLFFDEADALFGKRSEVRDSHDRYANIEISYLLQKLESYEGAAILATNLNHNMDDCFLRRFAFSIRFPLPDEAARLRIWTAIWPDETPVSDDMDFEHLAARFRLTGGNIKNIALASAFLAAEDRAPVTMMHVFRAIEREYQKMGSVVSPETLAAELQEDAMA